MAQIYGNRSVDQVKLRFPEGLVERIKDSAKANNRSMNGEIVSTLEIAYPSADESALLKCLKDVRPFLNSEVVDVEYVDIVIARAARSYR